MLHCLLKLLARVGYFKIQYHILSTFYLNTRNNMITFELLVRIKKTNITVNLHNIQKHLYIGIVRTCWIYNLCRSIRIYKNQIHGIDPYVDL